ncbi:MAG TPA: hypothetical protein VN228_08820 [Pyrinomonadaceae bacterium]|nr:hypothetical protein [Pyrinomonadaceae bacterium]
MRRALPLCFAAVLLPCGAAACLCALAFAAPPAQSATNINGNMNAAGHAPSGETPAWNSNSASGPAPDPATRARGADAPHPRRPPAPPSPLMRWTEVGPVPGLYGTSAPVLRAGASADARAVAEVDTGVHTQVEVLETKGDFVRVRCHTAEGGGRSGRSLEGWLRWGEALPSTTALVLDPRSGRVLRRVALGPGIDSVAFSPDGRRALYHGRWAESLYEADASDLVPARRLKADAEGSFGPAAYAGTGRDMLAPFWAMNAEGNAASTSLHMTRADAGGNVTAAPAAVSPAGAQPSSVAFAPDGRTGFAFYAYPYGDEGELTIEQDRGTVATVEVFDPQTLQTIRRFKLPDPNLSFDPGSLALNADGSELYLLDHPGQRLVVVEAQTGGVVREVSLAGVRQRWFGFARPTVGAAGPLVNYWDDDEEHHSSPRALRVEGWRAVPDAAAFAFTAEAAGTLYAVNDAGTHLITLDAEGRPRSDRELDRPQDYQTPIGLFSTPDGSRLILLLAIPEDGC